MRIAQLIESDGPGGAERVVVHLVTQLQLAGHSTVVYLPAKQEGWLAAQLQGTGATIEEFRLDRPVSPSFGRWMTHSMLQHRIEVAHSHEWAMATYCAWAASRAGIPHVITMHGGRYYAAKLRRRLALRWAATCASALVAVSASLKASLSQDLWLRPERILLVRNGVPCREPGRSQLRSELGLSDTDCLLLAVGNLYPVKGHLHLLEALPRLSQRHRFPHLAIAGRGELAEVLTNRARALGLEKHFHLLGLRDDIPELLAAADVFVHPSLSEGLPMAVLEAMFAGRPIVASSVGEIPAVLGGDGGLIVPPADPESLARAIECLLEDPGLRTQLSEQARRRAGEHFSLDRMVRHYLALYRGEPIAGSSPPEATT